jgi:hypothetical protein
VPNFDGPNAEKPPGFAGGFGLGAIRELVEMYTTSVTIVKKLFLFCSYIRSHANNLIQ